MSRKIPTYSQAQLQASLIEDIAKLENLADDSRRTWLPGILALMRELHTLSDAEPLDEMKLQQFASRAKEHVVSQKLKGCSFIVWQAEDLIWHATHVH